MDLAFSNDHFVAVDKPAGWLSVPSRFGERDERPCVGRELQKELAARLWPVHRLDEEVTGLLLFAREPAAHAEASRWFEQHLVTKTYEALTEVPASGMPPAPAEHVWQSLLLRGKRRAYEAPHGKPATTRAVLVGETLALGAPALSWTLEPITGRAHQLRFELARHAAPVLGDVLYGARTALAGGAIALRCVRLEFTDDVNAARFDLPHALVLSSLADWMTSHAA